MLTGDKEGTARTIGKSCGIIDKNQRIQVYGGSNGAPYETNRQSKNKVADIELVPTAINKVNDVDEKDAVNVEGGSSDPICLMVQGDQVE